VLDSGELGTVRAVRIEAMQNAAAFVPAGHWYLDGQRAGGGIVISVAIHKIDLLRYLLGDVVRVVHATPDGRDVDVTAVVRGLEWEASVRSFRLKVSLQTQNPTYTMFVLDDTERGVLAGTDGATTYAGTALAIANSRS
jgi:predicted dehydrogenase